MDSETFLEVNSSFKHELMVMLDTFTALFLAVNIIDVTGKERENKRDQERKRERKREIGLDLQEHCANMFTHCHAFCCLFTAFPVILN